MADADENGALHDGTDDDSLDPTQRDLHPYQSNKADTMRLDFGDGSLLTKENGPESQRSRRSTTSNPLGEIASDANTPRAFFGSSSKRLLESHEDESGGSVSWLSNTFSTASSKGASTVEAKSQGSIRHACSSDGSTSTTPAPSDESSVRHPRGPLPPRRSTTPRFGSVRSGAELLREAGTSFTDEGTSVVSSWLDDATAKGIFRSLHVNSMELSCGIPTPPSSRVNSSTTPEEPVLSLQAPSSSWADTKEDYTTPKNENQPKVNSSTPVENATPIDMKQFDQAYDVWRQKGLLSDEKPKPSAVTTPTPILQNVTDKTPAPTLQDVTDELFEPDPSVASARRSQTSSKRSTTCESSSIKSNHTPQPFVVTSSNSKPLKSRRETLAVVQTSSNKDQPRRPQRQSLPATAQESTGFANILKSWQSKSANKPCPHFLSPQQTGQETHPEDTSSFQRTTEESQCSTAKNAKAPPPLRNRRASASPIVSLPALDASPLNCVESPIGIPPKSQAWKMKRQSSDRMLSATSSAATKTAQNDKSQAASSHWSFGRSSSRGRAEDESGDVIDKYTSVRQTSVGSKKDPETAKDDPLNINAKTPTAENALLHFANATNRLSEYFVPPRSVDSNSTVTPTIPREVAIAIEGSKNSDTLLSPFTTRLVRNLEKMYNQADEVRTPAEKNFADRPWRRDSLVARVDNFQDDKCHCVCSESVFSGNDAMIDFFLPLMGTACTCGQRQPGLVDTKDPTSLANILRPWQVEFLGSFGIYRGEELVKANHRSAPALASALRSYRKKLGMTPFRTKSCGMALQIWSRTSKAFVRSIRSQLKATEDAGGDGVQLLQARELRLPNALYIVSAFLDSMPSDAISQGPGSSAGCDQTLTSTITGSHSSGDGANWSTITPGATVEGEI